MNYTTNDIQAADAFSKALHDTCTDIMNGMPKSRACEKNGISRSMLDSIMKGLRRRSDEDADPQDPTRYKPWQDALIADLGLTGDTYLPPDFEEQLESIEASFLSEQESAVINAYYKEHMTLHQIAEEMEISDSSVTNSHKKALRVLKKHRDELVLGREMSEKIQQLRSLDRQHEKEIDWLNDAIDYCEQLEIDSEIPIEETDISDEAKDFYYRNGFRRIANVMSYTPAEIFEALTNDTSAAPR